MTASSADTAPRALSGLCGAEGRLVALWRRRHAAGADPVALHAALADDMGAGRAAACLAAAEDLEALLTSRGWRALCIALPGDSALTPDEDALCCLVMAAAEGARETALETAMFLVRPDALLPVVLAASRVGLPLLCAECRARLSARPRRLH